VPDLLKVSTERRIDELWLYLNTFADFLNRATEDHARTTTERAFEIGDETVREEFLAASDDRLLDYTITLPRILLNSFHVSAYTLFESELFLLTRRIGRKKTQPFDVGDLKGEDYLEQAGLYLLKTTGLKLSSFASWTKIREGQTLRNLIVHSNAVPSKQGQFDLVRRLGFTDEPQFRSSRSIPISVTTAYCHTFLRTIKGFFAEFYSAAGDHL